ncbi:hypothetical protein LNKW23_26570 [Paralimibaculum aggregatum]|uniref:Uncharacterized protein n=1 Tax=Paralimibaculum aggregatum TaxID=3036245 RepID=A0ABQ6LQV3_9RHOB|nr:FxsA family protein [Limibaculum sp. NKW23]GMG83444.1 hypothetical protein LNKW23_26570 [Limibaculum sp. NKW23]
MLIFLALVAVPIIEIALFIEVGGWIGLWPTIAIVIATAVAGTALLRAQGMAALGELQRRLDRGGDPSGPLAHGALILVAGIMLLTPGFFTDTVGFLLLIPPVRALVIRHLAKRVVVIGARRMGRGAGPGMGAGGGQWGPGGPEDPGHATVETGYREVDEPAGRPAEPAEPGTGQLPRERD